MGKGSKRKAVAAPPRSATQQKLEQLPLLKKPLEHVGTQIKVPGSFWQGRMSAEEKATLYVCSVRDFSALHDFHDGRPWITAMRHAAKQESARAGLVQEAKSDRVFSLIQPGRRGWGRQER